MSRVTLKKIAKEAGVSVATVSLALRGQGRLSKANVDRIRSIAERLGYTPDPMLASLAAKRFRAGEQATGRPLALLEFPAHLGVTSPTTRYRESLIEYARRLGYAPTVYSLEEMSRYNNFPGTLYQRGTQAVVICGQPDHAFFASPESWSSFAMVQCEPEAYISFTSGLYYALQSRGIRFPEDAGFASLHMAEKSAENTRIIAGLDQSLEEIAYQSILLADQMVRHNDRGIPKKSRHILIESNWLDGASLRPPPSSHSPIASKSASHSARAK